MLSEQAAIESLRQEYAAMLGGGAAGKMGGAAVKWDTVVGRLHREADWTYAGAEHVGALARNYGSFVLRNALALALALEIEDGELRI